MSERRCAAAVKAGAAGLAIAGKASGGRLKNPLPPERGVFAPDGVRQVTDL